MLEARARLPARRTASSTTPRSAGASSTRAWPSATRPSRWARRPRTWPSATASRARTRTRSRSSRTGAPSPPPRPAASPTRSSPCDVPQPKGDPVTVARRRGPAPRHHARDASPSCAPVFREGGTRHRRQLVRDQRRRGLPGAGERGARRASSAASRSRGSWRRGAAGVDPAFMGIGPVPAIAQGARARRPRRRRHRPGRAQRGVRRPGARLACASSARPREGERERRRDRARPPARLPPAPACSARSPRAAPPRRAATASRRCASASARASPTVIENPAAR